MPYFSIIIPTYNSEEKLDSCLNSIINQSFTDFEVLIIDNLSTDQTLSIVRCYQDSRFKIISEPDKGIYDAMNKGIQQSTGDWLYFIGSDDSLNNNMVLGEIFDMTYNTSLSVIYGNVLINGQIYDGLFDFNKIQTKNICHQAIFYSRELLIELGGYNLKYHVFSDYDLNLKWFFHNKYKSIYVNKIIANYSANGFSTKYHDTFYEELPGKLTRLGIGKIKIKDLKICALNAAITNHEKQRYIYFFYFKILYYTFRIINLFQEKHFIC